MSFTLTSNMNLPLPNPAGSSNPEPGPQYAADQNQAFTIIDSHDHSPGAGVQITPAGLNINSNLTFQNNNATNIYGVLFSAPTSSSLNTFLYTNAQSGGGVTDLFYNDGAGNIIPITKAGAVNASLASLPGESYSGGTFTWVQGDGSTTPANFDIASITIRPATAATTYGVVLSPPTAISSQYNVQLPLVPGAATGILQINTSGDMISTLVPDNLTIVISSQVLKIPDLGITTNLINTSAVTTAKIANAAVTGAKLGVTFNTSSITSSGNYTVPSNVYLVEVLVVGGGGGGGGTGATGTVAGGGGGGAGGTINRQLIAVTPAQVIACTIGAGGTAGAVGNGSTTNGGTGGTGGTSTFGTVSAPGGVGGAGGSIASSAPFNRAPGGTGGGGGASGGHGRFQNGATVVFTAGVGGNSVGTGGTASGGGGGGASYGNGGNGGTTGGAGNASANTGGGAGGGGTNNGALGGNGGVGGSGIIIVTEYI